MKQTVFIDESGTPNLSDGNYYVICAASCSNDFLDEALHQLNQIRIKHKIGSELKSSSVGGNFQRRVAICRDLSKLKLRCYVFALRKSEVNPNSGLSYKTSGYKFCQSRLFEKLYKGTAIVNVVMDSYGTEDFMAGFERYIHSNFNPDLFNQQVQIRSSNPRQDELLQVSDFVSGTIRRSLESSDRDEAFKALGEIVLTCAVWPRSRDRRIIDEDYSELDSKIEEHCTTVSLDFIERCEDGLLSETVLFLLNAHSGEKDNFIYGDRLLEHLNKQGLLDSPKDKTWLQQRIISSLRAEGVPIAASPNGYKIPRSRSDLRDFIRFVSQKTLPYLKKVNDMRTDLSHSLGHAYDMLDEDPELKELMKSLAIRVG